MSAQFKAGQYVRYEIYGVPERAQVVRVGGNGAIVWLDNGRWMHAISCVADEVRS